MKNPPELRLARLFRLINGDDDEKINPSFYGFLVVADCFHGTG